MAAKVPPAPIRGNAGPRAPNGLLPSPGWLRALAAALLLGHWQEPAPSSRLASRAPRCAWLGPQTDRRSSRAPVSRTRIWPGARASATVSNRRGPLSHRNARAAQPLAPGRLRRRGRRCARRRAGRARAARACSSRGRATRSRSRPRAARACCWRRSAGSTRQSGWRPARSRARSGPSPSPRWTRSRASGNGACAPRRRCTRSTPRRS